MWAPPEDDTVTPGATSTVVAEPVEGAVDVGDVEDVGDEEVVLPWPGSASPGVCDVAPSVAVWPPAVDDDVPAVGPFAVDESLPPPGLPRRCPRARRLPYRLQGDGQAPMRPMKSMCFNVHTSLLGTEPPAS